MKMLLRDFRTGLYLGCGREWTQHLETARTFANRFRAEAFRVCHGLPDATVVAIPGSETRRWLPYFPTEPDFARKPAPTGRTTLEAKIELGLGNSLFIRGEGGSLNWHRSQAMTQIDKSTWIWSTYFATQPLILQLLLNDLIWAKGENLTLEPGMRLQVLPDFEWPEIPRIASVE